MAAVVVRAGGVMFLGRTGQHARLRHGPPCRLHNDHTEMITQTMDFMEVRAWLRTKIAIGH